MAKDVLAEFLKQRMGRKEDRPVDRLAMILSKHTGGEKREDGDPSKKKFNTPDHIPPTPDGDKPTIRRPRRTRFNGPSM